MNAVEIADAVSDLFQNDFDPAEFPFAFLKAFGNKPTTIQRLRSGNTNASDVPGGVLQKSNIHLAVCAPGAVGATLAALRTSPKTAASKAKFILATDGEWLEAEDLRSGEPLAVPYAETPAHFGFFLELGGISTVKEIKENPIDIRATGRLNKLYVELLKENPEWATEARRPDMNHLMARLIFCFFAEDTHIFHGDGSFTDTVKRMTEQSGANVHEVFGKLFEAMNLSLTARKTANLPLWAEPFPYVNGGLFSGSLDVPRFTRIARSYLLAAGDLNWREINPDIFGSMIQAVADDEERGALGMHYTSVPNILKVLNPLFLDDLRAQLERAGEHKQSLLRLRERMARIRVFDPACGSGNFLVIAYKEMRKIEAEVNRRRGEEGRSSDISLRNFCGIEIRDFAAEIARLALIVAEYQANVRYRGEQMALMTVLPLNKQNWIVCGNALRLDWIVCGNALRLDWTTVCPPAGTTVKVAGTDLFSTPLEQAEIDFAIEGRETYICGNPPYAGLSSQTEEQKDDLQNIFQDRNQFWKSFDYVMAWFLKASDFMHCSNSKVAFVSTNSICQGQQVPMFWPAILDNAYICFAHTSFKWKNLASKNAGVTVVIIGLASRPASEAKLFEVNAIGDTNESDVPNISPYLVPGKETYVYPAPKSTSALPAMYWGNKPTDGGNLILSPGEARQVFASEPSAARYLRNFYGSVEYINNSPRVCIWVTDQEASEARKFSALRTRFDRVKDFRASSKAKETRPSAAYPHRFRQIQGVPGNQSLIIPIHSSESRNYLPVGLLNNGSIVSNAAFALYDAPLWNMALIASRPHLVWIGTVCGKLKTDYRYSNTLGWNTFPVPTLTEQNKTDLTRCAEDILLAREAHFPATIADLYDPEAMPDDLRRAHERNDETLERIYVGRRFRSDTERLEKLFEMYTALSQSMLGKEKRSSRKVNDINLSIDEANQWT